MGKKKNQQPGRGSGMTADVVRKAIEENVITHKDVLLGRGAGTALHKGNQYLRQLMKDHALEYRLRPRIEKSKLGEELYEKIKEQDGTFFELDRESERPRFIEVAPMRAIAKIVQGLRDADIEVDYEEETPKTHQEHPTYLHSIEKINKSTRKTKSGRRVTAPTKMGAADMTSLAPKTTTKPEVTIPAKESTVDSITVARLHQIQLGMHQTVSPPSINSWKTLETFLAPLGPAPPSSFGLSENDEAIAKLRKPTVQVHVDSILALLRRHGYQFHHAKASS